MLSNDSRRLTYTLKTNPPYRHLLCLQHKVNADALREPTQEPNCGLCIHNNISRVSDIIKSQCHTTKISLLLHLLLCRRECNPPL